MNEINDLTRLRDNSIVLAAEWVRVYYLSHAGMTPEKAWAQIDPAPDP